MVESVDAFKIMDMVGINKTDQLFCFDLINVAKSKIAEKHQKQRDLKK